MKPLNLTFGEVEEWEYSDYIYKNEFEYIHSEILKKVEIKWNQWNDKNPENQKESFPVKNKGFSEKLHGFGKFDPNLKNNKNRVSVEKILKDDEDVVAFINLINYEESYHLGQHLYKILYLSFNPKVSRRKQTIEIPNRIEVSRKLLLHVYFVFLGYRGLKDFRNRVIKGDINLLTPEPLDKSSAKKQQNIEYDYYIGLFYSEFSGEVPVKTFILEISKEKIKNNFIAIEYGYHNIGNIDDKKFIGTANRKGGYLYVNLENDGRQLNIIGAMKTNDQKIIRATLQSVSTFSRLLSTEAVLIRISESKKNNYLKSINRNPIQLKILDIDEFRNVSFYLTFKRNSYHIEHEIIKGFQNFEINRNKVADYEYLVGQYRIWNFTFGRGSIVQSRFTIYPNGTGLLEPFIDDLTPEQQQKYPKSYKTLRNNLLRQKCLISIDTLSSKIWVIAYPDYEKTSIIANVALFDYQEQEQEVKLNDRGNAKQVIKGTFSSIGINPHGIMAGYIIMVKDPRAFDLCEFSGTEAAHYASNNNLKFFHSALYDLWRKKLWPETGRKPIINKAKNN